VIDLGNRPIDCLKGQALAVCLYSNCNQYYSWFSAVMAIITQCSGRISVGPTIFWTAKAKGYQPVLRSLHF